MSNHSISVASAFLYIAPSFFLLVYALPLLLAPIRWARLFRWQIPEGDLTLAVYFGRCLGGVATAVAIVCLLAANAPEHNVALFDLIALVGALMTGVHVWGAFRERYPWPEHAEIVLYAALTIAALAVRPS
jgi:hypothetical protein